MPYTASAESFNVISNKEFTFMALPYFFNINNLSELEFEWSLGTERKKQSSFLANLFGLKIINQQNTQEGSLEERLNVSASNRYQINQKAGKTIYVNIY